MHHVEIWQDFLEEKYGFQQPNNYPELLFAFDLCHHFSLLEINMGADTTNHDYFDVNRFSIL